MYYVKYIGVGYNMAARLILAAATNKRRTIKFADAFRWIDVGAVAYAPVCVIIIIRTRQCRRVFLAYFVKREKEENPPPPIVFRYRPFIISDVLVIELNDAYIMYIYILPYA